VTPASLTDAELDLLARGTRHRAYDILGAHLAEDEGGTGTRFVVWAPSARAVSVIGDFNAWDPTRHPMRQRPTAGVWEVFIPGVGQGALYKYAIVGRDRTGWVDKADPYAFASELPPQTASRVWDLSGYQWRDAEWVVARGQRNALDVPMTIYEVHLGSWRRVAAEGNRWLTYRELAPQLAQYLSEMGYTHVEFLPVSEHPFDGSWGYQTTGYFAPTSRFGTPQDLMFLVDTLHQHGIGVILDWVPAHFPRDEHALASFDGTPLYELADPNRQTHPEWGTLLFDYGRPGVATFLLSNALFWLDTYHIDGLRVDAVASILYYVASGGDEHERENRDGIAFLRRFNELVHAEQPGVVTIAEESTAWPLVSRPMFAGGLGFGLKWDMGWEHDTLVYLQRDPNERKYYHNVLTFRMMYAFTENFVLPLSHDDVVYGKGSLLERLPGDRWQQLATLRLLLGYLYTQPGRKLLFMGTELAQVHEWDHDGCLDWALLDDPAHRGMQRWVRDLNTCYRGEPALHEADFDPAGFAWIDCDDALQSTLSYERRDRSGRQQVVVACNFTPAPRYNVRLGAPHGGYWAEVLNSDASLYGGSGVGNLGGVMAAPIPAHGRTHCLTVTLPPLGMIVFKG
jgi:1,4-alpha-glucan branching enzyme